VTTVRYTAGASRNTFAEAGRLGRNSPRYEQEKRHAVQHCHRNVYRTPEVLLSGIGLHVRGHFQQGQLGYPTWMRIGVIACAGSQVIGPTDLIHAPQLRHFVHEVLVAGASASGLKPSYAVNPAFVLVHYPLTHQPVVPIGQGSRTSAVATSAVAPTGSGHARLG
jgi:hypothetical protein